MSWKINLDEARKWMVEFEFSDSQQQKKLILISGCFYICVFSTDDLLKTHNQKLSEEMDRRSKLVSQLDELINKCNAYVTQCAKPLSLGLYADDVTAVISANQVRSIFNVSF